MLLKGQIILKGVNKTCVIKFEVDASGLIHLSACVQGLSHHCLFPLLFVLLLFMNQP